MPRVCGERKHITKNLFHKSQQQLAVLSASTSLHQSSISPSSPSIQQQLNPVTIYRSNESGNNTNTNHSELSSSTISGNSYTNSNSNGNSIQPFQNQQQQENNQRNQSQLQPQNSPHFQNQQNANEGVVQIPKPETSETVSVGTTSSVSGNIRYHGKTNVADSNPIGVRCGRREWNAAQSLVKLNAEQIRTTTNITATPPIEMATLSSSMPSSSATQSATTTATKSTSSGPVSPTEGSVAPLYYSNAMDIKTDSSIRRSNVSNINTNSNTSLNGKPESNSKRNAISKMASTPESKTYLRTIKSEGTQEHVIFYAPPATSANGTEKPYKQESSQYTHISSLYRERSIEETEAAHDLLSLSQSLPPLPAPCVVTIHQQEESSNYTVSNSPVMQEISNSSNYIGNNHNERVSIRIEQDNTKSLPSNHQHQNHNQPNRYNSYESSTENCSPLTPPTSEHSSDIEVDTSATDANKRINKLPHDDLWNPELSKVKKEKIFIIDGRSKNRKPDAKKPSKSRKGSYKCSECGRAYATSSNLSRHKQTHRSLDSQSAKKCHTCGKAYVSMPALAMHLLTHKLTHSCGICGKLFSRPWLLQGHLRSHTGEKPYVCAHCGKAFADRSNLRAHMQTHSSSKKYKCPRCLKTFALKSYLNKHLESACYNDKDFLVSSDENDEEDIIVT